MTSENKLNERYKVVTKTKNYDIITRKDCVHCGQELEPLLDGRYCPDCLLVYRAITLFKDDGKYLATDNNYFSKPWSCPGCGASPEGKAHIDDHKRYCREHLNKEL